MNHQFTSSIALAAFLLSAPGQLYKKTSTASLIRPVQFQYGGTHSRGPIETITSIAGHLTSLCSSINNFGELPENWDNYGGTAPSKHAVENSIDFLVQIERSFLPYLNNDDISPNPHGTISIEWANKRNDFISVEIGDAEIAFFYKSMGQKGNSGTNRTFPNSSVMVEIEEIIGQIVNHNDSPRNPTHC